MRHQTLKNLVSNKIYFLKHDTQHAFIYNNNNKHAYAGIPVIVLHIYLRALIGAPGAAALVRVLLGLLAQSN
jgi:hypothetical protein